MYSQLDEEQHILKAFWGAGDEYKSDGRFLDIGAWNPREFSNTRALYELGWSGVMIEPSPGPMLSLLKEYGNDERITLIQAAVVCEWSLVKMHVTDDAVTTAIQAEFEKWKERAKFHGSMLVPGIMLSEISNQFGGFDFVNIDAEGISVDLFKQAIDLEWRPTCFCVEIDGREHELAAIAEGAGYKSVNDLRFGTLGNGTNVVLVHK